MQKAVLLRAAGASQYPQPDFVGKFLRKGFVSWTNSVTSNAKWFRIGFVKTAVFYDDVRGPDAERTI